MKLKNKIKKNLKHYLVYFKIIPLNSPIIKNSLNKVYLEILIKIKIFLLLFVQQILNKMCLIKFKIHYFLIINKKL